MFTSGNITLRKISEKDLSDLVSLKHESWKNTHHITICNMSDQMKWFHSLDNHPHSPRHLFLVACSKERKNVGVFKIADIDYINRTADVGWDVYEQFRNAGNGKNIVKAGVAFCFEVLNLRRLNAEILVNNPSSMKCAESAGFSLEGRKIEAVCKEGVFIDSLLYGLLQA